MSCVTLKLLKAYFDFLAELLLETLVIRVGILWYQSQLYNKYVRDSYALNDWLMNR